MEVDACRDRLAPFCTGVGLDIGFGGTPITTSAICVDRPEDDPKRAANPIAYPTHIEGDWKVVLGIFKPSSLDFIFSSHVLEDFADVTEVLQSWASLLKHNGRLVLFLPDEQTYRKHCEFNGSLRNQAHVYEEFGLEFVRSAAKRSLIKLVEEYSLFPVPNNPYSFDLVLKRV